VIFLSALVEDEDRLAGYAAGGNDCLSKPVLTGELLFKVDQALLFQAECRQRKGC
jgi:DNA-binding response OmpR family regulator